MFDRVLNTPPKRSKNIFDASYILIDMIWNPGVEKNIYIFHLEGVGSNSIDKIQTS